MLYARARVVAALGEHRMIPIAKEDVIVYIGSTAWRPDGRELLYRSWCHIVGVSVLASDLRRCKQGRVRERNRSLDFEG